MEQAVILLNEKQAAAALTVSEKTLQAWRVRGGGPRFIKVGRLVRYRPEDLDEYIHVQIRTSTAELPAFRPPRITAGGSRRVVKA